MKTVKPLGVIDTIYEEEFTCSSPSSPSHSPSFPSHLTPLQNTVDSWSLATGRDTDVVICVQGTCFHLHKEPLTTRSIYLREQLWQATEIKLQLHLSSATFALVADFCYGTDISITPFNVAALRTAAELLGMTEINGKRKENLRQITESYFRRVISISREFLSIVFRTCLRLLPEAETAAFLISRCIQALSSSDGWGDIDEFVGDILSLSVEEFGIVVECMHCALDEHDLLYKIIELYIHENGKRISEEEKLEMCNFIDCDKLSAQLLLQAVQNSNLPLRFIVRAMLIEQLNTRRTIFNATSAAAMEVSSTENLNNAQDSGRSTTLRTILEQDTTTLETCQLKSDIEVTIARIRSLERELDDMKKILSRTEKERTAPGARTPSKRLLKGRNTKEAETRFISSSRSASFHYDSREASVVGKCERGSVSFAGLRSGGLRAERAGEPVKSGGGRTKKSNGKGLISRIKNTLWVTKPTANCRTQTDCVVKEKTRKKKDDRALVANNASSHVRRNSSFE